jgi:hypothetical protein
MLHRHGCWLRGLPIEPDMLLNLLAGELVRRSRLNRTSNEERRNCGNHHYYCRRSRDPGMSDSVQDTCETTTSRLFVS